MSLTHFTIPESSRGPNRGMLDPITVFIENGEPGKGQLTVRCWGRAWTAYWGAMGNGDTVQRFLIEVSAGYAANCLIRGNNGIMLKSAEKREMDYVTDIVAAVQKHLRELPAVEAAAVATHDWKDSSRLGGELCGKCGAPKGTRRGGAPCTYVAPEPIIIVDCKSDVLGNSQFWRGPVSKIGEIRNIPARETAFEVAKDGKARSNGMWHVRVETAA